MLICLNAISLLPSPQPSSRINRPATALIKEIVLAMKDNAGLGKMPGTIHICPALREGTRLSPLQGVSVDASAG
ncbi:Uncharacterised protein [Halioglobus japonicus]|nr:Uncharacterised protein [Halioglobus japonicus]